MPPDGTAVKPIFAARLPMSSRVLVLYTGGTIGMADSSEGYRPLTGFADKLADVLNIPELPEFDVLEFEQPIDSANLQPAHWTRIGRALVDRWSGYAGFVILHGTDTMAWTASALSFMLRGMDKPVILTGSQIPLLEAGSDAPGNLRAALKLASRPEIREVAICFGRFLLRGNRCSKVASRDFDAFASPNYPPLADAVDGIDLHPQNLLPAGMREFAVPDFSNNAVAVLTIHPGLSARAVEALLADISVRGLVLHSYGLGNIPDADPQLIAVLSEAVVRGIVVVNVTQCATGGVAQGTYATGSALTRIGVIPGGDMTLEATFAKLSFLLSTELDISVVSRRLGESFCGELT